MYAVPTAEAGGGECLLGAGDPDPVEVVRPSGASPFFLTCEHAGREFPARLGTLGLTGPDLDRHIAWDIGAAAVARGLSERLDATLVLQRYSRLVVDCNRVPDADDFVTELSEDTLIPGNRGLSDAEIDTRAAEIFHPYHDRIHDLLEARVAADRLTVVVSVHTCTPVYHGVHRPWHIGVMYEHDDRLARAMLAVLREEGEEAGLVVGDNEPYFMTSDTDYSMPRHGQGRGVPHVGFEIRQDLVESAPGQHEWAERMERVLRESLGRLKRAGEV
ncbi:MAG: N-formylglutamate amidohydrolase [Thiotrichales bacterium]|nr:N-formylglutamate amidohydrolase [Thiotrichales bacterium]